MGLLGSASVSDQKNSVSRWNALKPIQARYLSLAGTLAAAIALLLMGVAGYYLSSRPTVLRFAVGSSGDARLVQLLAHQLSVDRSSVQIAPLVVADPAAASGALDAGQADIAIVHRDLAYPQSGKAIAVLRESVAAIIVPVPGSRAAGAEPQGPSRPARNKRKPISSIEDLQGRRIGLAGSANIDLLNTILDEYQIAKDKVTIVPLDPRDIAGSLRGKTVDVLFVHSPVEGGVMADAIAAARNGKNQPTLLGVGASEAIAARRPVYETAEIKARVLGGQPPLPEEAVETVSSKDYIVAHSAVPEGTAAELTRLLFDARQHLSANLPSFAKLEKPDTDRDAAVAAHPGAAAFLDKDQKTFLEKYNDVIYLGLMLLSGLGSLAAWLLSYGRKEHRLKRLKTLNRLTEIVKVARAAATLDELSRLRGEIDDMLRNAVEQAERHELAETSLMAFSLALDQAQLAVAERRTELTGLPQRGSLRAALPRLKVVHSLADAVVDAG